MKKSFVIPFLLCLVAGGAGCRSVAPEDSSANTSTNIRVETGGMSAADSNVGSDTGEKRASPVNPEVAGLIAEGRKHFEEYRNDEAVKAFERALEIDPENGEAHYRLGLVRADAGDDEAALKSYEAAIERLEKVVRENEDAAAAHRLLALSYGKLDKHAEAVKAYKQVVRLEPDDSYNHYELGLALTKLAQYPEAVQSLKKATQLDPDNFRAAEALDRAQEGVRRRDAALKRQEEELRRQEAAGRARPKNSNVVPSIPSIAPTPNASSSPSTL